MVACTRVFLDLGANIGVNMRFLYEAEKYPNTKSMISMMDKVLGKNRSDVCYYGFEANTAHYTRLKQLTRHFKSKNAKIWNHPVDVHDQNVTFYHANTTKDYKSEEWGFSRTSWTPNGIPVQLKALDFPRWFNAMKFDPAVTTILMKMDIEGSEYKLLAALLAQGFLCSMHTITIEWHPQFCRGKLCSINLRSFVKFLPDLGCRVKFIEKDDESYLHDGQPLGPS
jgi:FkbM family methyltransferase